MKIGGASVTDKSQFEQVKLDHVEFIVESFKNNYTNLILIHGAGSFGYVGNGASAARHTACHST